MLGLLDFAVLSFDFGVLLGQQLRFFLHLGIGHLQLFGQGLALLQKLLGAHGGRDRIEHDADTFCELIQKRDVNFGKLVEGG